MRKKILIAGGISPFEGPWINLEEGDWLVEPPSHGKVILVKDDGEIVELNGAKVKLFGPTRVRAIIEEAEEEIHLDAVRVA